MPKKPTRVLVTGASGFLGQALSRRLRADGYLVTALSRHAPTVPEETWLQVKRYEDGAPLLVAQDCVVHLAARVHVMNDGVLDPLAEFRAANVDLTILLAQQAAQAGVRRFIFISSVKVNGEETAADRPFTAEDTPRPQDPYGVSKMEAEQALRSLAVQTGMEVVIIRPPLVYGPGVRANFGALLRVVARGVPLPFGALQNRRSLVALDNLVDLIACCVDHPKASGQTFMVSDGEDLSTPGLIRRMAQAMGKPARLFDMPVWFLRLLGKLTGKSDAIQRLCGYLQVDISKTKAVLGWKPPISVDEGLRRATVQWPK
ncbi:MAG: SDR family oxidoreductase [Burkholderiales bacterium]|nr:SDR family oxidoreductase [Burkholderiales bacterium]